MVIATYIIYLTITLLVVLFVAWTLHRNGYFFLLDVFGGNKRVAQSVNALMVIGFCLVNVAMIAIAMKYGDKPTNGLEVVEIVSSKIGGAILVLGVMHFGNLMFFSQLKGWYCRRQLRK
ncbi:hypothetical protein MNBD_PLANCTO02-110 [hydrothermal vent metagenome]|uniref:Uncharacterized protein n=1 Tax=hydrothermal vent metagenome TaxID=652676 RepID=A0A3B1D1A2_9ZZZZ